MPPEIKGEATVLLPYGGKWNQQATFYKSCQANNPIACPGYEEGHPLPGGENHGYSLIGASEDVHGANAKWTFVLSHILREFTVSGDTQSESPLSLVWTHDA